MLAAVGVLTSLEPARQVAAREGIGVPDRLEFSDVAEGAAISLAIAPGVVGPNEVVVSLADRLRRSDRRRDGRERSFDLSRS